MNLRPSNRYVPVSFFLAMAIVATLIPAATGQQEMRTWKSASGKFSIEASLLSNDDGTLTLKDANGKTIKVPLDKLSNDDKKFVEELGEEENPFKVMEKSDEPTKPWAPIKGAKVEIKWGASWYPGHIIEVKGDDGFLIHYSKYSDDTWDEVVTRERIRKPGNTAGSEPGESTEATDPGAKFALTTANLSTAKKVTIGDPAWNMSKITAPSLKDLGKVKIKLPNVPDGMDSAVFAMNQSQTMGFLAAQNGVKERNPQLAAFNLTTGELLGSTELPLPKNFFRDVSADGSILLSSSGSYWPKRNRVDRWKIKPDGTLEHLGGIELKQKVSKASFTSTGTVLISDTWGQVSVWDFEKEVPQALFTLPRLGLRSYLALSQDKRILFGSGPLKVFAIDLKNGACRSSITHGASAGPVAVTSDYAKVAMATGHQILIWDNAGKKIADFYVPGLHGYLQWLDDRYLTTGSRIIDTESKIELCALASPKWFVLDGRGDYWMFNPKTKNFGNAPAMMKFETMIPEDLDKYFVLKEGDTVALDIAVGMPAKDRQEVESNIKKQLQERGVKIDNKSEFRIKMSQKSSSESQQYRDLRTGATTSVTSQRTDRTTSLVKGDLTLISYSESSGGSPGMISKKDNETMQQAANRSRGKTTYDFFKNFRLPKDIAFHPQGKPFANATFDAFK